MESLGRLLSLESLEGSAWSGESGRFEDPGDLFGGIRAVRRVRGVRGFIFTFVCLSRAQVPLSKTYKNLYKTYIKPITNY